MRSIVYCLLFVFGLFAQNTYFGPTQAVPGNPHLVRIEVSVQDSPDLGGVQIQSVQFDGQDIPLKPRDVYGYRAKGSFQLKPGTYKLIWVVNRDKSAWPRNITHTADVTVNPRDLLIEVLIEGEQVSIR